MNAYLPVHHAADGSSSPLGEAFLTDDEAFKAIERDAARERLNPNDYTVRTITVPSVTVKIPPVTKFTITDANGDESIDIDVKCVGSFLKLSAKGYGNPVSLDLCNGELRVLLTAVVEADAPKIIVLEPAKE